MRDRELMFPQRCTRCGPRPNGISRKFRRFSLASPGGTVFQAFIRGAGFGKVDAFGPKRKCARKLRVKEKAPLSPRAGINAFLSLSWFLDLAFVLLSRFFYEKVGWEIFNRRGRKLFFGARMLIMLVDKKLFDCLHKVFHFPNIWEKLCWIKIMDEITFNTRIQSR